MSVVKEEVLFELVSEAPCGISVAEIEGRGRSE